ncbi:MAG TPA: cupin domain-containing protein [Nitrosospira sp.]|nr:cupin domain-containing protein [Nitrosospira sp.]
MKLELLGEISPKKFLRDCWQKKPLLIRQALPGFTGLLSREQLVELACRDDAQSRLIVQAKGKWKVKHGPFQQRALSRLPETHWTLLVQDVNHFFRSARDLLLRFNFIPYSRLDDLMVSYAPEGGGVGPHFDSYDVFLLQGMGRRQWQISAQQDSELVANAPLKILRNFKPEQEWLLEPGDMLYLPPGYAHNGIAKGECMTYSIGFRAPSYQELATQFLVYLQDHCNLPGMYQDPDLKPRSHPGKISSAMLRQAGAALDKIKWTSEDVERFMGIYLTEPKPHVFFKRPSQPVNEQEFTLRAEQEGLELDLKSRMLWKGSNFFLNGEFCRAGNAAGTVLKALADHLEIQPAEPLNEQVLPILYQWYLDGFVTFSERVKKLQ